MPDYVTRKELDVAIAEVKDDIEQTEKRLRSEWTNGNKVVNDHLDKQDETLSWILRSLVGALLSLVVLLAVYAATHP